MNTEARHDLYAPIHKALRLFMSDTLATLGRLDLGDPQERDAGLAQVEALLDAASHHLRHENEFVHPALDARRPGTSATIAADHQAHLGTIAALRSEAAVLRALPTAAAAHRLYRQLAAFVAENFEHMDVEETRHNHALWATCSDAELQAIEGRIHAHIGAQEMATWLRWLIPALNPAERAALIGSMPPEAQGPVLASARPLLDDKDWAKLCRALEQAAAVGWTTL